MTNTEDTPVVKHKPVKKKKKATEGDEGGDGSETPIKKPKSIKKKASSTDSADNAGTDKPKSIKKKKKKKSDSDEDIEEEKVVLPFKPPSIRMNKSEDSAGKTKASPASKKKKPESPASATTETEAETSTPHRSASPRRGRKRSASPSATRRQSKSKSPVGKKPDSSTTTSTSSSSIFGKRRSRSPVSKKESTEGEPGQATPPPPPRDLLDTSERSKPGKSGDMDTSQRSTGGRGGRGGRDQGRGRGRGRDPSQRFGRGGRNGMGGSSHHRPMQSTRNGMGGSSHHGPMQSTRNGMGGSSHHRPMQSTRNGLGNSNHNVPERPQSMMMRPSASMGDGNGGPQRPQSMMLGGGRGRGPKRPMSMADMGGRGRGRGRGFGRGPRQASLRDPNMGGMPPHEGPYNEEFEERRTGSLDSLDEDGNAPQSFRAPNKPQSILRNSSHHARGSALRNSSHHTPQFSTRKSTARINADGSIITTLSSDSQEEDLEFGEENMPRPLFDRTPSMLGSLHNRSDRPGIARQGSFAFRDSWKSFRQTNLSRFQSTRSILTADLEFDDEPKWKTFLRYIRILAPHKDEKPIKRNIRIITWVAMVMDFLAALVSITTYNGVSFCCGQPVLSIAGNINWTLAVRITTYIYMILIFAEIVPVLRNGVPWNLLNPFVGFLITFAVFFDDRILEAVVMWLIEATAVAMEFFVYRLRVRVHKQRAERLEKTEQELKGMKDAKRKLLKQIKDQDTDSSDDDASFGEKSFHDETTDSSDINQDLSQVRETRLLRERRLLRLSQSEDRQELRYHFIGVCANVSLVGITLMLICCIGRSGGLCVRDMVAPNVFKTDQLERCYDCQGTTGVCEVCREDGTSHCYYPYF